MIRLSNLHPWLEQIGWPRSYLGKIFLICFVGTHVPLICLIVYLSTTTGMFSEGRAAILLVTLMATLAGTAFALVCLHGLLRPISEVVGNLRTYAKNRVIPVDPVDSRRGDLMSRLRHDVASVIRELEKSRQLLEHEAKIDPVTNTFNRQACEDRLRQDLSRVGRDGSSLTIAMIDIDQFKRINDGFGHPFGDECLLKLTDSIGAAIREGDWLGRYGGDEFILVLWNPTDDDSDGALERVEKKIREDFSSLPGAPNERMTVSFGVVRVSSEMEYGNVIAAADAQLLRAKQSGKDRVSITRMD